MKAGICVILSLVMAGGPWVCCCAAGPRSAAAPAPDTPAAPSCCHAKHQPAKTADSPLAPARPCSCQHERQPQTLANPDNTVADEVAWGFCAVAEGELAGHASNAPARFAHAALPSFHDGPDILSLCHILRC